MSVVVIGAGVVGLSTGITLLEKRVARSVTIVAKSLSPDTTSDGAGALWRPVFVQGKFPEQINRWSKETFDQLWQFLKTGDRRVTGVNLLSGYELFSQRQPTPEWSQTVFGFREVEGKELEQFNSTYSHGWFYTTLMLDSPVYLAFLTRKFQELGGRILVSEVKSLSEFSGKADVVVNCSGLGARTLVNDTSVVPSRGQTIKVKAPHVKHFCMDSVDGPNNLSYIFPRMECVVLGGTYQPNNYSATPSQDDERGIKQRCHGMMRDVVDCEVKEHWAGLRPSRVPVRVEVDGDASSSPVVVHNYGHGGSGMTLHWGCANDVAGLVAAALSRLPRARL